MTDPYEELANAIILQTVKDYRDARRVLARLEAKMQGRQRKDARVLAAKDPRYVEVLSDKRPKDMRVSRANTTGIQQEDTDVLPGIEPEYASVLPDKMAQDMHVSGANTPEIQQEDTAVLAGIDPQYFDVLPGKRGEDTRISRVKDIKYSAKIQRIQVQKTLAKQQLDECAAFFVSDWFKVLSNVDGEMLLNKLQKEDVK